MPMAVMLPSGLSDLVSTEGLSTIAGAGSGLFVGEFMGTLVQTLTNTTSYIGEAARVVGYAVASGVLFAVSRFVPGMAGSLIQLAAIAAPGAVVFDLLGYLTKKTATSYAQVSAISLRQMLKGTGARVRPRITVPQVIYSKTLRSGGVSVGQVLYKKTLG